MKISPTKTKTTVFRGKKLVRAKIVLDNKILEHARNSNYVG
jgi:hypothetical protein